MYKKLVKNSAIYGILPQLPKIASFFVLPLITPFLTGADYGVIGVLSSYIGALSVFHLLGTNIIILNSYYHHPMQYKWYWRQIYGFIWLWSILYVIILSVIIYVTLPDEAYDNRWSIILMKIGPLWLFGPSDMLASTYYRLKQKAWPIASRSLFAGLIGIGLNYFFIAEAKMGYMGWITSEFIANMTMGALFFIPVYRSWGLTPIFNFKRRLIKKALKVSLPIIPHNYGAYLLNSSDKVVMERLDVPIKEIGLYSLAYNFGTYINTLTLAVNQAIGPSLYELIKKKNWKQYEEVIFSFQSFMLFVCFSVSLWVPQWLPLLVRNKELLDIDYLLIIIVMSYSFKPIYIGCNQVLFYYEKTKSLWKISFVAGVVNVVSNIVLIPFFGIKAAAFNTFIALIYMSLIGFTFKYFKEFNKASLYPLAWLVVIVAALVTALAGVHYSITKKILIESALLIGLFASVLYRRYKSKIA